MTSVLNAQRDDAIDFEGTELRLGLPGGNNSSRLISVDATRNNNGKRGFSETEVVVDLKLNLASTSASSPSSSSSPNHHENNEKMEENVVSAPAKPPAKAQVVGWPPVRSFRKNILKNNNNAHANAEVGEKSSGAAGGSSVAFVKVSVDGAPYLRKVDLKMYESYRQLSDALGKMFSSFTIGNYSSDDGLKDFMNESKLIDLLNGSDFVPTYEDKDGDWMLVGDVPWEMFVDSCKRLRIMKGSEAIGLAPRAVEKRKNRS